MLYNETLNATPLNAVPLNAIPLNKYKWETSKK